MEKILALIAVSFGKKATVYAIGRVSKIDKSRNDRQKQLKNPVPLSVCHVKLVHASVVMRYIHL